MPPKASAAKQQQTEKPPPEPVEEPDELIGRVLGDTYQIESVIGQGGVGRVYRARHNRIRTKLFALKVLHPEHSRDAQQLARFQQEAEAAAALSHPNVVGVYDVGRTDDGYSYLACELLNGLDLDAYIAKYGKLDLETALLVGLQICEALEVAHGQNVVHRDLKPQNVFLQFSHDGELPRKPDVKLLDFGLSRFLDHTDTQLTKTGTVMGTPAFMAPEQAMGQRGDHRVDVYGIGIILYTALTGETPFKGDNLTAMLVAVMTEEAPRPRKLVPDLPEAVELVIQRAMAKEADQRYASVTDVKNALTSVLQTENLLLRESAGYRPQMGSVVYAEDNYNLKTSRPRLIFYAVVSVLIAIALVTSAVSGLEIFTGPIAMSRTELGLVLAGIAGTVAMPAAIGLRSFRRTIWSNSAKVMDALERLRGPLSAVLITYGAAAIGIRFFDDFISRFGDGVLFGPSPGLGWSGFTWVLLLVVLFAGSSAYFKRWAMEGPVGVGRRMWLGAPLWAITSLIVCSLIFGGLKWRARDLATHALLNAQTPALEASREIPESRIESAPAAKPTIPPPPTRLATDEELAKAVAVGVDGLLPLSESCPKDPRVLEPLLLAFASRTTGLADAMVTAERLLEVAPEKRDSENLGVIVMRAAKTPGNASERALSLMQNQLGEGGADLLYQLFKAGGTTAQKAEALLSTRAVKAHLSPALRVLLELEAAETCEDRLPLLGRAAALGDHRSASLLIPLAKGSKTGCGKWKNRPCPAKCKDHSKEYWHAVETIQARSGASEL
jgi:serine/threonine protein kinase